MMGIYKALVAAVVVLSVGASVPLEALCWGSLYIASTRTWTRNSCPTPTVNRLWRLHCYDGCGYSQGLFPGAIHRPR